MGIGRDLLDDPVAPRAIGIDNAIKQRALFRILQFMIESAPFLVEESFAVGDEELEIARVRLIDVWIINLIDDPVRKREPHPATAVISRADSFLCTLSPARFRARQA